MCCASHMPHWTFATPSADTIALFSGNDRQLSSPCIDFPRPEAGGARMESTQMGSRAPPRSVCVRRRRRARHQRCSSTDHRRQRAPYTTNNLQAPNLRIPGPYRLQPPRDSASPCLASLWTCVPLSPALPVLASPPSSPYLD